jgi:hypothetical protein
MLVFTVGAGEPQLLYLFLTSAILSVSCAFDVAVSYVLLPSFLSAALSYLSLSLLIS